MTPLDNYEHDPRTGFRLFVVILVIAILAVGTLGFALGRLS